MKSNEQLFSERSHPSNWFQVADELHNSLLELYNTSKDNIIAYGSITYSTHSKAYMLLAGYSLENLVKSILIVESPELIEGNKMSSKILIHDLSKLYAMSKKIKTNAKERELLSILSEATPYWGRYPIPRYFNNVKDEKYLSDKLHESYMTLFKKSRTRLYNMTKNGYKGLNGETLPGWFTSVVQSAKPRNVKK